MVEAPKELPIKVVEAREHLKQTGETRDAEILRLIYAATEFAEGFTGRTMITQTLDCVLEAFPSCGEIKLPRPPLQAVVSLKYRDEENVEQTMPTADYEVDANEWAPRIVLATDKSWPGTYARADAVTARIRVGYGGAAKVPYQAQAACLLHVEAHFDRDERMMEKLLEACERLLWPLRNVGV